jgi:hypothetical protein
MMARRSALYFLAALCLASSVLAKVYFVEEFNDDPFENNRWVISKWKESEGERSMCIMTI